MLAHIRRVPKMIDGGRDDAVKDIGPVGIAIDLDKRIEIVAVYGVVDRVVGNVSFTHSEKLQSGVACRGSILEIEESDLWEKLVSRFRRRIDRRYP